MTKKQKNKRRQFIGLVISVVLLVGLVAGSAVSAAGSSWWSLVKMIGTYLEDNPQDEKRLAGLFGEQLGGEETLGSIRQFRDEENSNFRELGLISDITSTQKIKVMGVAVDTMPATGDATTTQFFQNRTGRPIYIDLNETFAQFNGLPSSTVDISMATSTSNGLAAYTTALPNTLIQRFRVATSTVTQSQQGLALATTTARTVFLANNEYILWAWYQSFENGCTGAICEAVTSTARGYTATTTVSYYRFIDY